MPKPYRDYENRLYKLWLNGDRRDVWDHQFKYYLMLHGYLDAKPNSCLVSHLGTDADATHTGYDSPGYLMEVNEPLFNIIRHPKVVKMSNGEMLRTYIKSVKICVKRFLRMIDY